MTGKIDAWWHVNFGSQKVRDPRHDFLSLTHSFFLSAVSPMMLSLEVRRFSGCSRRAAAAPFSSQSSQARSGLDLGLGSALHRALVRSRSAVCAVVGSMDGGGNGMGGRRAEAAGEHCHEANKRVLFKLCVALGFVAACIGIDNKSILRNELVVLLKSDIKCVS